MRAGRGGPGERVGRIADGAEALAIDEELDYGFVPGGRIDDLRGEQDGLAGGDDPVSRRGGDEDKRRLIGLEGGEIEIVEEANVAGGGWLIENDSQHMHADIEWERTYD